MLGAGDTLVKRAGVNLRAQGNLKRVDTTQCGQLPWAAGQVEIL